MRKVNKLLKKYALKPHRYQKDGKVTFVDTEDGRYAIKPKNIKKENIYKYLDTRSFGYYPKILSEEDDEYDPRDPNYDKTERGERKY